jgi:2'-5' RNA ligase
VEHLAAALGRGPDPRWHITLAFLGEQADPGVFDLRAVAQATRPFPLALSGGRRLGRTVVAAGVRGDTHALRQLARSVQQACREGGAVLGREQWSAHLTVARDGNVPPALWDYEGPGWTVTELELVHSVLGRRAEHRVLETVALG